MKPPRTSPRPSRPGQSKTPKTGPRVRYRFLMLVGAAVVGTGIGLAIRDSSQAVPPATPLAAPSEQPRTAAIAPSPTGQPYSLSIPAQRDRTYVRSNIVTETPLPDGDGYRHGTISYYSDGLKIFARVTTPLTVRPKAGYPTIILAHGYVQPGDYVTDTGFYADMANDFARSGFLVVTPDFRGHGNSWGIPEGAYYSAGYNADILNLAASLPGYVLASKARPALVGHSMGGHVALEAAIVRPQAFSSVILAAGSVGREADMYDHWSAFSDFGDPVTRGIRARVIKLFGAPDTDSDFWKMADPYRYLTDLDAPFLLAHDPADDTVPYRFSVTLKDALLAAGRDVTLVDFDGGHSFNDASRGRLVATTAKFIRDHAAAK